jgi:hypothetical protein
MNRTRKQRLSEYQRYLLKNIGIPSGIAVGASTTAALLPAPSKAVLATRAAAKIAYESEEAARKYTCIGGRGTSIAKRCYELETTYLRPNAMTGSTIGVRAGAITAAEQAAFILSAGIIAGRLALNAGLYYHDERMAVKKIEEQLKKKFPRIPQDMIHAQAKKVFPILKDKAHKVEILDRLKELKMKEVERQRKGNKHDPLLGAKIFRAEHPVPDIFPLRSWREGTEQYQDRLSSIIEGKR